MTPNARAQMHADLDLEIQSGDLLMELYAPEICFQRVFVDLTGDLLAALLLSALHQCQESQSETGNCGNWMRLSSEELSRMTGLKFKQQMAARRSLRKLGFIQERRVGFPSVVQIQVNFDAIAKSLIQLGSRRREERLRRVNEPQAMGMSPGITAQASAALSGAQKSLNVAAVH